MKNKKAVVVSVALLLAMLFIGSVSASVGYYNGTIDAPQGFAKSKETEPESTIFGTHWRSSKGEIQRLNAQINANSAKIANLEKTLEESKTTQLAPGAKRNIRKEINGLKKENSDLKREINRLTKERQS